MLIRSALLAGLLTLLVQNPVYSSENSTDNSAEVGAFKFLPSIGISRTRNDNIFAQPHDVSRDTITRYQPKIQFYGRKGHNSYSIVYEGDYGDHDVNSHDDYDDHAFMTDFKFDGVTSDLDFSATYGKFHDRRGEGLSEGPAALLRNRYDQYDLKNVSGIWELGADTAMSVQVVAERSDIEYTNNQWITQYWSRQEDNYVARLYFKTGPYAKIFLEQGRKYFVYDFDVFPGLTRDSKEDTYTAGLEFYIAEKTRGVIRVGETQKDFKLVAVGFEQFDLDIWDAEVTWSPLSNSAFTLSSGRYIEETKGSGLFFVVRENELRWKHNFTDDVAISLSASRGRDFFQNSLRADDRDELGVLFEYDIGDIVSIGMGYHFTDLDSNDDTFDYDREEYFLEFTLH